MGFFYHGGRATTTDVEGYSLDLLHRAECGVCPLNHISGVQHPNMKPTGSDHPLVYMLGEAPGADEDSRGEQFVGKSGRVLRFRVPQQWLPEIRWNNCVRTRPPDNRTPTPMEIECCRPSIVRDIEATKPYAIFGFGNIPLHWALRQSGISKWNGRCIPITVGNHSCWYFPLYHPSYVMRTRKFKPRNVNEYGSDIEFVFAKDLERAFAMIELLPEPIVHSQTDALSYIEFVTGAGGNRDVERILQVLDEFMDEPELGLDYETPVLRPFSTDAKILTVALASSKYAFSWPLYHREAVWTDRQLDKIESAFQNFLYEYQGRKVAHHLGFEQEWTAYFYGQECLWQTLWDDTESQAYILDERRGCLSLDFLCLQYFGVHLKDISNVDRRNLNKTPIETVLRYNALDAKYHRLLYLAQKPRLQQEGLMQVYEHQLRRVPTMVLTQIKGVPIDAKINDKFFNRYMKELDAVEEEIDASDAGRRFKKLAGHHYQPSANRDVLLMMEKIVGHKVDSADETAIKQFKHPAVDLTIKWRKANKILSTYVKPVRNGSPHLYSDGLIHPVISVTQTRTWRTSSEDPNAQNWPKRQNKQIRTQVRPGGDMKVVSFDLGQIQARNVAMESKDKALIKAFWDRYDIHTDWMERILKVYPRWDVGAKKIANDKVAAKKARDRAKNGIVFPSFFGAQPKKLASVLEIPEGIASKLSHDFWEMFPDIKGWHEQITNDYHRNGYVTGLSGFRRRAPISPNELINAPIQADEALLVCDAMSRLSELGEPRFQANLEIHDDLTFIWPKHEIDVNAEVVIEHMLMVPFEWAHIVPIVVEMSVGDNWGEMEEVGQYASDTWRKV